MLADKVFRLKRNYCYNSTTKLYKGDFTPTRSCSTGLLWCCAVKKKASYSLILQILQSEFPILILPSVMRDTFHCLQKSQLQWR